MYATMNNLHSTPSYIEELNTLKDIKVEVVFGNPKKGCRGSGICRLNTAFSIEHFKEVFRSCRTSSGQINILSSDLLQLDIYKNTVCNRIVRKYFSSNTFYMPEPTSLFFGRQNEKELTLLAGDYRIVETQDQYTLYLNF